MATREDQETLRILVQHVSRGFYEPKFSIVLDQLARHPVLKDDDLAGRMGLQAKELNKLMAVLNNDQLVQVYRQNELKEGAQRSVGRQYYFINYKHFCDVVKWRIAEMRRIIDSGLRNELDNKGYICPQCNKSYTSLEVDKLMDFMQNKLVCEDCHAEVIDNENAENVKGSKDRMQRFNRQIRFIIEGLRKTESMIIPSLDVPAWIKANVIDPERLKNGGPGGGLKIAGSSGNTARDDGVGIMLSMDKDELTRRQERDAEAAAKRQQNALPAWHLKSTITGDLTALGIQENERNEAHGNGGPITTLSNDDMLKGLGVSGPSRQTQVTTVTEDVKPVINQEADYYDQYYASLAASNAASTQATPSGPGSDEEEEQKPNIQYLDSLNDYRKRSRSREDEGPSSQKHAKTEPADSIIPAESTDEVIGTAADAAADDPIVYVHGVAKQFSQVTEEDQELMTPEEYTTYFEVIQAQS
ncbi:hypothetical protein CONPUDRAFT_138702 [Coniophora puteana RWD-64-598 SS2]|uniref:HTH TFE/IIEalpha-type domain-containing protein n=1 Tax=Coniophora puteana (strain RWD-64-598) TaxID=741705 RepID=A0A5M3MI04_CONPW|nr:uncharacterized protein CONPUDRAFT_138702 [Coniophora puteana RWD-64-598 SS2]EIW78414.1 hypothetical protein CONPUDRAFT_138702 [Coniophora puteana RWD-64-598 SS2]